MGDGWHKPQPQQGFVSGKPLQLWMRVTPCGAARNVTRSCCRNAYAPKDPFEAHVSAFALLPMGKA